MLLDGVGARHAAPARPALLERVGLGDRADHRPDRLSGGEQQRVAIAVALANTPPVLLADEPTGELDTATSPRGLRRRCARSTRSSGVTIVVVTHDPLVAEQVRRTVAIRDGRTGTETLRRAAERRRRRAGRPSSPRSTPSSTAPAASSCRARTSRRSGSRGACGWRSRPTTSASGRTATAGRTARGATA